MAMEERPGFPKREYPFLVLSALFLSCLAALNIIGISKLIQIGPLTVAVGILPYPITFLCTDLISEIYGHKRANALVWLGLLVNVFILFVLFLAETLPEAPLAQQPPWQSLSLAKPITLADGSVRENSVTVIAILYACTTSSVVASMLAYLVAQFTDVSLFHFFKRLTKGKHLWLRNNASTLLSQWIDTLIVILITFYGRLPMETIITVFISSYLFKVVAAALDTPLFYLGVYSFQRWFQDQELDQN